MNDRVWLIGPVRQSGSITVPAIPPVVESDAAGKAPQAKGETPSLRFGSVHSLGDRWYQEVLLVYAQIVQGLAGNPKMAVLSCFFPETGCGRTQTEIVAGKEEATDRRLIQALALFRGISHFFIYFQMAVRLRPTRRPTSALFQSHSSSRSSSSSRVIFFRIRCG